MPANTYIHLHVQRQLNERERVKRRVRRVGLQEVPLVTHCNRLQSNRESVLLLGSDSFCFGRGCPFQRSAVGCLVVSPLVSGLIGFRKQANQEKGDFYLNESARVLPS